MPLFKSKQKSNGAVREARSPPQFAPRADEDDQSLRHFKYAPRLSKTSCNIGGLPVNIFGLDELTPSTSRSSAPPPPEICIAIHMHGRGGSADNEEAIVRQLWDTVQRCAVQELKLGMAPHREMLVVNFDARNHGHRMTSETGQKGWNQGNKVHAMDLYAMITGTAQDVSFLVDLLPSYLFPCDDRKVSQWVVTGKSLGGHATWHVLAKDPRVTIGVPFISCPSFSMLITDRARSSFVNAGPPTIPASLSVLISRIDPASSPYDSFDAEKNPFWGKSICMCNGDADKLVPWRCSAPFIRSLVTGQPVGDRGEMKNLKVVLLPGVGHTVTEQMIEEGGRWIYAHGIR